MRAKLTATATACLIIFLGQSAGAAAPEKNTYASTSDGFSLVLPSGWAPRKEPITALTAAPTSSREIDSLLNVKVVVRPKPDGITLETLVKSATAQWSLIWKILSSADTTIDGAPGKLLTIKQSLGPRVTMVLKAFVLHKDKYFIITFSAPQDQFEKSKPAFEQALTSFRFID